MEEKKQPSKGALLAGNIYTYVLPLIAVALFFTGKHTLFLCVGISMLAIELVMFIIQLIAGETWAVKLNLPLHFLPWFIVGCFTSHWNIIDGFILGEAFMLLMGAYMKIIDDIAVSSLDSYNEQEAQNSEDSEDQ